jgi:hypothetical protein
MRVMTIPAATMIFGVRLRPVDRKAESLKKNSPNAARMMNPAETGEIGDDRSPNRIDPAAINQDSVKKCPPPMPERISIAAAPAITTRRARRRRDPVRPIDRSDRKMRTAPKKIHASDALRDIVLHPSQTLLRRTIPEIFPKILTTLVTIARNPKAQASFLKSSASSPEPGSDAILQGGTVI